MNTGSSFKVMPPLLTLFKFHLQPTAPPTHTFSPFPVFSCPIRLKCKKKKKMFIWSILIMTRVSGNCVQFCTIWHTTYLINRCTGSWAESVALLYQHSNMDTWWIWNILVTHLYYVCVVFTLLMKQHYKHVRREVCGAGESVSGGTWLENVWELLLLL